MRLTGATEDEALQQVWAYLTPVELRDLHEALQYLLDEDDFHGWHYHLGDPGGPELTLAAEP